MSVDAAFVRSSAGKLGKETPGAPRDAVDGRDRVPGESRTRAEEACNRQVSRQGGFPIIEAAFQFVAYIDKWTIVIDLPHIYESRGNIRGARPSSNAPKYFRDCFVIR